MRIKLIKIGNSYGIRLPKAVITECDFKKELNLEVFQKTAVLSHPKSSRQGWREACSDELKDSLKQKETEIWQWNI